MTDLHTPVIRSGSVHQSNLPFRAVDSGTHNTDVLSVIAVVHAITTRAVKQRSFIASTVHVVQMDRTGSETKHRIPETNRTYRNC